MPPPQSRSRALSAGGYTVAAAAAAPAYNTPGRATLFVSRSSDGFMVLSVIVLILTNYLGTVRNDSAVVDRGDPSRYMTAASFIPESESVLIFTTLILTLN